MLICEDKWCEMPEEVRGNRGENALMIFSLLAR